MCTPKKAIKNVEVKVDVQKGALGFRKNLIIKVLVSFNSHFHSFFHIVIMLNDHLAHSLCEVCIWVFGSDKLEAFGVLVDFLEFNKLSYCLLDIIID